MHCLYAFVIYLKYSPIVILFCELYILYFFIIFIVSFFLLNLSLYLVYKTATSALAVRVISIEQTTASATYYSIVLPFNLLPVDPGRFYLPIVPGLPLPILGNLILETFILTLIDGSILLSSEQYLSPTK